MKFLAYLSHVSSFPESYLFAYDFNTYLFLSVMNYSIHEVYHNILWFVFM